MTYIATISKLNKTGTYSSEGISLNRQMRGEKTPLRCDLKSINCILVEKSSATNHVLVMTINCCIIQCCNPICWSLRHWGSCPTSSRFEESIWKIVQRLVEFQPSWVISTSPSADEHVWKFKRFPFKKKGLIFVQYAYKICISIFASKDQSPCTRLYKKWCNFFVKESSKKNQQKRMNLGAIVNIKNFNACVLEKARIWEKPNLKEKNTRPHFLTNRLG